MLDNRTRTEAEFIVKTGSTVRETAKKFGLSKSTIHTDVTQKLKTVDTKLYNEVRVILERNKAERHIRGGNATKKMYAEKRKT